MKRVILTIALVLSSSTVWAQEVIPSAPYEENSQFKWVSLDSGSTVTRNWYFNKSGKRNSYAGYVSAFVKTDSASTATQTVASYDSLKVVAYALEYDEVASAWNICQTALCTSGTDSISIANYISWGTAGHSDSKYTISKVLNFMPCDGIQIQATAQSDLLIRIELKQTKSTY